MFGTLSGTADEPKIHKDILCYILLCPFSMLHQFHYGRKCSPGIYKVHPVAEIQKRKLVNKRAQARHRQTTKPPKVNAHHV